MRQTGAKLSVDRAQGMASPPVLRSSVAFAGRRPRSTKRIKYTTLGTTTNTRVRFQAYYETDSPYDDPYSAGWARAGDEWYGRWVIVAPKR